MTNNTARILIKRLTALTVAVILLFGGCLCHAEEEETEEEAIKRISAETSFDRFVEVNGKTYYYYAQNNPVFLKTKVYGQYTVGGSSCSSTAISNVIINTINVDHIENFYSLTYKPIRIDRKCIQSNVGLRTSRKFEISTREDLIRFFPVCVLNFVVDNNKHNYQDHRNTGYYSRLLQTLGLEYRREKSVDECIRVLQTTDCLIETCTGGTQSPIANRAGHYFVMADADDEYVYFLDSMARDKYVNDKEGIIEILEPGVIRCRIENIPNMHLTGTKYIVMRQENTYADVHIAEQKTSEST